MDISPDEMAKMKEQVGIIPWWIRKVPGFRKISGFPLKNRFLLSPTLYQDFKSPSASPLVIGIVIHELEHIKRAKDKGFLLYHLIYRLSPTFRYQEELACHRPQFIYYKKVGYNFDLNNRARILSGSLYLWCVSYEKALNNLEGLWSQS
jgi:hypothetical protein